MLRQTLALSACLLVLVLAGCRVPVPPPTTKSAPPVGPAPATLQADSAIVRLFDGRTLTGWRQSGFAGEGEAFVRAESLILPASEYLTGVTYTGPLPATMSYEIELEARRINGSDFFCGLTFPVGSSHATLIVGGWGGSLVGISCIDSHDAANNSFSCSMDFENGRWYRIRLRILPQRLQAWIDEELVVDVDTRGRELSVRIDIEQSRPLGLASFRTDAAIRNITFRRLRPDEIPPLRPLEENGGF
jgi:hypothetical protein